MATPHESMRAIAIRAYGGPEVLEFIDVPRPVPAAAQVLIRVTAIGVNPADGKWRAGMFAQMVPLTFPYVPGYDVAGIVEQGTSMAAGTRVLAMLDNRKGGAYAPFAVAAEDTVAQIPEGLGDDSAAGIPTAALTGVQVIDEHVVPRSGDRILITGACGAVGRFAVYAAKRRGARVIAAVRATQRHDAASLGADEVLVLGEDPRGVLGFDHVVDSVGGQPVADLCKLIKTGGTITTVSTTPIPTEGLSCVPQFFGVHADGRQLAVIARAVAAGNVTMPIARTYPLSRAVEAHRILEAGGVGGKIILHP